MLCELRPRMVLSILILLSSACAREEGERHRFRIIEEDGVTIAETTGGPKYGEDFFRFEKVLELRFDGVNEETLLVRPSAFTVGPDGYLYVADNGNYRIAVFDIDGTYIRTFG